MGPNKMKDESLGAAIEIAGASMAGKTAYVGAGTSMLGWFLSSEGGILIGALIGVTGLILNWFFSKRRERREQHFQQRQDEREQREHEARMRSYGARP